MQQAVGTIGHFISLSKDLLKSDQSVNEILFTKAFRENNVKHTHVSGHMYHCMKTQRN